MKTVRTNAGPLAERPHFEPGEIDRACAQELKKLDLMPTSPSPIRIERFIEKRFGITPTYGNDLPPGVLGYTEFGKSGVQAIVISRQLAEEEGRPAERRVRATLAHEAGHGLLHSHLFVLQGPSTGLFDAGTYRDRQILCRDVPVTEGAGARPRVSWSEFQANGAIGGLLLPRKLVTQAIQPFLQRAGTLGGSTLDPAHWDSAVQLLADTFEVNPIVARIRLETFYGREQAGQLHL